MRAFDELPEDAKRYARFAERETNTAAVRLWQVDVDGHHRALNECPDATDLGNPLVGVHPDDRAAYWAEVEYERRQLRAREKRLAELTRLAQETGQYDADTDDLPRASTCPACQCRTLKATGCLVCDYGVNP